MRKTGRAPRRTDEAPGAGRAAQTDRADTTTAVPAEPAPAPPAAAGPPPPEGEAPAPDAPTAPTAPTAPVDPDTRIPAGLDGLWTAPAAPDRPVRLRVRMSRTDPMSVLMTSFLLAAGLVVCAAVTLPPLWIVLTLLDQDVLLPPLWQLGLAIVGVVLFTVFATVCALCFNLSARCVGGIDLALAEALPDTRLPDRHPDPDPDTDPDPGPGPDPGPEQDPGPEPATAAAPSGP
ncbi:DUF3566 domain-containing protein [Streptomyces seoulensis]